jgi:rhodanese-related sulfurtransferase
MDLKVASTIGFERASQAILRETDESRFVAGTTASLPPQPPNFRGIVALNRGPLVRDSVDAHPLTPRQVQQAAGALVVDVRTELQFDEAHLPGSVSITSRRAGFGSKLAWLAKPGQPIVLVGRDDADARAASALAGAVGIGHIAGYLAGGMTSWREDKLAVERLERMTVPELHQRWWGDLDDLQLLDVREQGEWEAGHIPGSVHRPYHDIHELPGDLDPDEPIAVICGSGQRSAVAAGLLQRFGAARVIHVVDGGVPLWRQRGWPTVQLQDARP